MRNRFPLVKYAWLLPCLCALACASAEVNEHNGPVGTNGGNTSPGSTAAGGTTTITLADAGVVSNTPRVPIAGDEGETCTVLAVTIRDFSVNDPSKSFDNTTDNVVVDDRGMVEKTLGPDQKPVWAKSGPTVTVPGGKAAFDQWYHDVPGVNYTFRNFGIKLEPTANGNYAFDSAEFFPIDNLGWGNEDKWHNFVFTTEIHTQFTYKKGQKFTFRGDDDVFVFVNRTLALDLGGIHMPQEQTIDLDTLGLTETGIYPLDVFQAERFGAGSNFRIETSIDCFVNIPIL